MTRIKMLCLCAAITIAATVAACSSGGGPDSFRLASATQNETISQAAMGDWFIMNQNNSSVEFTTGPGTPPAGNGSVCFDTGPDGAVAPVGGKPVLSTEQFNGTKFADIDAFSFWTYVEQASPTHPWLTPAIKLQVDLDGNGTRDRTLVFEPGEQVGGTGAVLQGTWQQWDALAGRWWNTGAGIFPFFHFTLAQLVAAHPNAQIVHWHPNLEGAGFNFASGQNSGGFWSNVIGCVDGLEFSVNGDSLFTNFEATTKEDCKKGGWEALGFKNQGECVSAHVANN